MSAYQEEHPKARTSLLHGLRVALCCSSSEISAENSPTKLEEHCPTVEISTIPKELDEPSTTSETLAWSLASKPIGSISEIIRDANMLPIPSEQASEIIQLSDLEDLRIMLQAAPLPNEHPGRAHSGRHRDSVNYEINIKEEKNDMDWLVFPNPKRPKIQHKTSSEIWNPVTRKWSCWDDFFEGEGESRSDFSALLRSDCRSEMSTYNRTDDGIDSEISNSIDPISLLDLRKLTEVVKTPEAIAREGEVFLLYMSKIRMRCVWVSLKMRLETVAEWLNEGSIHSLPISDHIYPKRGTLRRNFRKLTIEEAFGDRLDASKEGINFFIGPVDGHMSFKMSVCDLCMLKRTSESLLYVEKKKSYSEHDSEIEIIRYSSENLW